MRSSWKWNLVVLAPLLVACTHNREDVHVAVPPPLVESTTVERDMLAVDSPPLEVLPPAPAPRPRLSQTITLGASDFTPTDPRPSQPSQGTTTPTVIVNNYNTTTPTYGYYPAYGPSGFYGARPTTFYDGRGGSRGGAAPQWGSSGWEGARRTAAPGQTPNIGGNWAPPPSYGPAPMR